MKKDYASPLRHWALTDSPARTDVALFIHRAVHLIILRVADLLAGNRFERTYYNGL
ncbi:MAG TPA: hypothetical protein VFI05_06195 [Nitrospiraceae bacterium]|jgi:hypothetical protein|nr:hypothetical protein [Nitrospiraceae bacterium]